MCPPSPAKGWAFPETRSVIDPLRWGSIILEVSLLPDSDDLDEIWGLT